MEKSQRGISVIFMYLKNEYINFWETKTWEAFSKIIHYFCRASFGHFTFHNFAPNSFGTDERKLTRPLSFTVTPENIAGQITLSHSLSGLSSHCRSESIHNHSLYPGLQISVQDILDCIKLVRLTYFAKSSLKEKYFPYSFFYISSASKLLGIIIAFIDI